MRILFIVNMEDLGFEEPLGVMYLSKICKEKNHQVYVSENNYNRIEKMINEEKPDLLALSILTPNFPYLLDTVNNVKQRYDIPVIMGGPHATFFPEIIKENSINYLIVGEGEKAWAEFLDKISSRETATPVMNVVSKANKNPRRPLISNLDEISFPDRELFRGYEQFYASDVRSVIASRGCPYMCSYCFNYQYQQMYKGLGAKLRVRSVSNIIEECLELKERYHAKMIHFFDDIFPFDDEWIEDFADKYKMKIGLPFITNTSFNVCSEHYVRNLSRAGCKTLLIGVETGNETLREKILFRKISNKKMIEKAHLIHKYNIKIYTQNLIGIPCGSLKHDIETLRLNIDLKADFSGAYFCQPYPQTAIEQIAKDAGLLEEKFVLSRSFYYSTPLKLDNKKEIERLHFFFPLVVNFPILINFLDIIFKIPPFIFKILGNILHGYKIRTVVLRYDMSLNMFIKNLILFFKRKVNRTFHSDITVK